MCVSSTASRSRSLDRVSRYRFVRDCFTLAAITRAWCRPRFRFHEDVFASAIPGTHVQARVCVRSQQYVSVHPHSLYAGHSDFSLQVEEAQYKLLTRLILGYAPTYLNSKLLSCLRESSRPTIATDPVTILEDLFQEVVFEFELASMRKKKKFELITSNRNSR